MPHRPCPTASALDSPSIARMCGCVWGSLMKCVRSRSISLCTGRGKTFFGNVIFSNFHCLALAFDGTDRREDSSWQKKKKLSKCHTDISRIPHIHISIQIYMYRPPPVTWITPVWKANEKYANEIVAQCLSSGGSERWLTFFGACWVLLFHFHADKHKI